MKKHVNVYATNPIRNIIPPLMGTYLNIEMDEIDIYKCICGRAIVDEVLSDGSLVRLDFNNYKKINEKKVEVKTEPEVAVPVVEEPIVEPVVEPEKVEETVVEDKVEEEVELVEQLVETGDIASATPDNTTVATTKPTTTNRPYNNNHKKKHH